MKKLTLTLTVLLTLVAGTADAQTSYELTRALRNIEWQLQQATSAYQRQQEAATAYHAPVYSRSSRTRRIIGGALQGFAEGMQRHLAKEEAKKAAEAVERRHGERQSLLMAQHAALMTQLEALNDAPVETPAFTPLTREQRDARVLPSGETVGERRARRQVEREAKRAERGL